MIRGYTVNPYKTLLQYVLCPILLLCLINYASGETPSQKYKKASQSQTSKDEPVFSESPKLTRQQVIEARRKYRVKVLSYDATQEIGSEFPYSDYVRLKITNGSKATLPYLTVLTKRFNRNGKMIGSSRAPSISVQDLKPGQNAEIDYYPRGHLPYVKKITVEIEALIAPDIEKFFPELPK
jgi:hypothetical protein